MHHALEGVQEVLVHQVFLSTLPNSRAIGAQNFILGLDNEMISLMELVLYKQRPRIEKKGKQKNKHFVSSGPPAEAGSVWEVCKQQ